MKRSMRKTLSVALAGTMALSLAACGGGSQGTTQSQAAGAEQSSAASEEVTGTVTIKLAHNMDFVTIPDAVVAAADRLNEKYKAEGKDLQIEIEQDYQRIDWGEYMQNVIFATKNNEGPDIFSVSGSIPDHVRSGLLLDMSDIDTSRFVDGAFNPFTVDDKIYAMPFDVPTRAIYYNKDVLVKAGWTQEDAEKLPEKIAAGEFTWNQFLELCKETQEKGAAKWGLLHRPGNGADFLDVLCEYGSKYYNDENKLVVNEETVTRFFQAMYDAANTTMITPHDLNQQGWGSINTMVGDGSAFAYYGPVYSATYVAQAVNETAEQFAEHTAFAVFPKSDYNDKPFTVAAPQAVSINANTKYPDICKELLKEIYAGDCVNKLEEHGDTIFSLSSVKAANEMDKIKSNPILAGIGYMTDYVTTVPPVEGLSTYQSELFKQIVLLELGQVTPEDAFKDFKAQVELNVDAEDVIFE